MTNVIIPSSDEDRKRIRGAMEEISNSQIKFTNIKGNRNCSACQLKKK